VLLPRLEPVPSFDDWVVDFLEQVQGFNSVVHDSYSDVRQYDAASDRLVQREPFAGLLVGQSVLHVWCQEVFHQVLVFGCEWRESPRDLRVFALSFIHFVSHC